MKLRYYKCNKCGTLVYLLSGRADALSCCGGLMESLHPKSKGFGMVTYKPVCQVEGRCATVLTGDGEASLEPEHPSWICLETDVGSHYRWMKPNDVAGAGFVLSEEEKPLRALAYYSKQGLWENDQVRRQ